MAGGPIVLNYSANVKDAVAGTDELAEAVGQTADAAEDAQSDISKSADKTLASQKAAAKGIVQAGADAAREQVTAWSKSAIQQGKSIQDVQHVVDTVYGKIDADVRRTNATIDSSTRTSWDKAEQAVRDFGTGTQGVLQTASSALGSFDGSISSIGSTISGLATLIPGVGGLIGGALGGIATGMFNAWDQASKDSAAAVAAMYDDMIESGNDFVSEQAIGQAIQDIIKDSAKLDDVKARAAQAGVSVQTALRAEAGDKDAISSVIDGATAAVDRLRSAGESATSVGVRATENTIQHYRDVSTATDTAVAGADLYRQATSRSAAAMTDAELKAKGFTSAINGIPRDVNLHVNVDDAAARERLRQLGKTVVVDIVANARVGRVVT